MLRRTKSVAALAAALISGTNVMAQAQSNPLEGLPSKAGEHVERIKALGDNEWGVLGVPAADPKWGTAPGRSWGGRSLTYAPDLGGAFFTGEGVHGYTKPNGYYMCDLWFYDANGHRWICLYPGVPTKTVRLKLDSHGFEVDEKGEDTPIGFAPHAYASTTYDPDLKQYFVLYSANPWANAIKQRQEWLGVPPEKRGDAYQNGKLATSCQHPLLWDVRAGKWERRFVEKVPAGFHSGREYGLAQYLPSLKKTIFTMGNDAWLYDYPSNTWSGPIRADCPIPKFMNGCYDPKRERLYAANGRQIAYFDLKAKQWVEIKAQGQPETFDDCNRVCLTYDTVNDVLLYHYKELPIRLLAAYEPDAGRWIRPADNFPMGALPKELTGFFKAVLYHSFYHEGLNAHFYYLAFDSTDGGCMVAYRYKRCAKEKGGR